MQAREQIADCACTADDEFVNEQAMVGSGSGKTITFLQRMIKIDCSLDVYDMLRVMAIVRGCTARDNDVCTRMCAVIRSTLGACTPSPTIQNIRDQLTQL
jgi:hypothetical protein